MEIKNNVNSWSFLQLRAPATVSPFYLLQQPLDRWVKMGFIRFLCCWRIHSIQTGNGDRTDRGHESNRTDGRLINQNQEASGPQHAVGPDRPAFLLLNQEVSFTCFWSERWSYLGRFCRLLYSYLYRPTSDRVHQNRSHLAGRLPSGEETSSSDKSRFYPETTETSEQLFLDLDPDRTPERSHRHTDRPKRTGADSGHKEKWVISEPAVILLRSQRRTEKFSLWTTRETEKLKLEQKPQTE